MRNEKIALLIDYLRALCEASRSGVKVYTEIRRAITEIEQLLNEGESENDS